MNGGIVVVGLSVFFSVPNVVRLVFDAQVPALSAPPTLYWTIQTFLSAAFVAGMDWLLNGL